MPLTINLSKPFPNHLSYLTKCASTLSTSDGHSVDVWEITTPTDTTDLSNWAKQFRLNYCLDEDIDILRDGTGLSRSEYLENIIFPDIKNAPGPAIRAGDFTEILISDYVEHILNYWVPRMKYAEKSVRNESVKGVDIVGFFQENFGTTSLKDRLLTFEVKAQLSEGVYKGRLQTAIDDSSKDYLRLAETLNATKQRLHKAGKSEELLIVQRFQNLTDNPYQYRSGAAAVIVDEAFDVTSIQTMTSAMNHPNKPNLELIVIRGKSLMNLVHALYERAANEA